MAKTPVEERRAHFRVPAIVAAEGTSESDGVVARLVARNLSAGGLSCTSSAGFPEMTRLAVRLMLPHPAGTFTAQDEQFLDVEAVVVRREELPASNGGQRYELALFFTRVADAARRRLDTFLEQQRMEREKASRC